MNRFQDKVVVITGGNGGIGMAVSRAFSSEGGRVVLFAKDEQAAIDAAASELGNGAWGAAGDITQVDSLDNFFSEVEAREGKIDVLIGNAGICLPGMVADTDEKTIDLSLNINVKGTFLTVQRALPHMNDGATVVLTSSISNVTGIPGLAIYGASKAAVRALVRTMARELIGRNIRVNAVSPAPTDTETMAMPFPVPEEMKQEAIDAVPMKRLARPDEIAKAILFLASSDASFITGTELAVDGGTTQL